jgi:hypothetical protein
MESVPEAITATRATARAVASSSPSRIWARSSCFGPSPTTSSGDGSRTRGRSMGIDTTPWVPVSIVIERAFAAA